MEITDASPNSPQGTDTGDSLKGKEFRDLDCFLEWFKENMEDLNDGKRKRVKKDEEKREKDMMSENLQGDGLKVSTITAINRPTFLLDYGEVLALNEERGYTKEKITASVHINKIQLMNFMPFSRADIGMRVRRNMLEVLFNNPLLKSKRKQIAGLCAQRPKTAVPLFSPKESFTPDIFVLEKKKTQDFHEIKKNNKGKTNKIFQVKILYTNHFVQDDKLHSFVFYNYVSISKANQPIESITNNRSNKKHKGFYNQCPFKLVHWSQSLSSIIDFWNNQGTLEKGCLERKISYMIFSNGKIKYTGLKQTGIVDLNDLFIFQVLYMYGIIYQSGTHYSGFPIPRCDQNLCQFGARQVGFCERCGVRQKKCFLCKQKCAKCDKTIDFKGVLKVSVLNHKGWDGDPLNGSALKIATINIIGKVESLHEKTFYLSQVIEQLGTEKEITILMTNKPNQGLKLNFQDFLNVRISSKGKIMFTFLGQRTIQVGGEIGGIIQRIKGCKKKIEEICARIKPINFEESRFVRDPEAQSV